MDKIWNAWIESGRGWGAGQSNQELVQTQGTDAEVLLAKWELIGS
jgi:hypothetical protein